MRAPLPQVWLHCNHLGKKIMAVQKWPMQKKESGPALPERERHRRRRQKEALQANLKRRKMAAKTPDGHEKDPESDAES
jgi:hypothetical protein